MKSKPHLPHGKKDDSLQHANHTGKTLRREPARSQPEELIPAHKPDVNRIVDDIILRYSNFGKTD